MPHVIYFNCGKPSTVNSLYHILSILLIHWLCRI